MLLTLLVLGALAKTLTDTGKIRANRAEMDRTVEEYHALSGIRADVVAALQILNPGQGDNGGTLKLRRVDPDLSFPQRVDETGDPTNAYEPSEKIDVRYRIRDGVLVRGVGPVDGDLIEERLQTCKDFDVTHWENAVVLKLTFEYSRVQRTRVMKVELR